MEDRSPQLQANWNEPKWPAEVKDSEQQREEDEVEEEQERNVKGVLS